MISTLIEISGSKYYIELWFINIPHHIALISMSRKEIAEYSSELKGY